MKTPGIRCLRGAIGALLIALVVACAQLPLQQREVVVPLSRLTEALTRKLGEERKFLDVFTVRIGDPKLATDPAAQRLRADFAISLSHPFSSRPVTGRAAISGALGYDAQTSNVTLLEPRIDRLDLDAVPAALRDVSARLASALGRELVGSLPLATVREKDLSAYGRSYRVAGFELVEGGVRVVLRAVD